MFRSKRKRRTAIAATAGILAASLAAGLFLMPAKNVEAAARLYGVQQVVDELSGGSFHILELVSDHANDSLGYLITGSEPVLSESIIKAVEPSDGSNDYASARRRTAAALYEKLNRNGALVSFDASSETFYQDQVQAPQDLTGWGLADFSGSGHTEKRTGYFAVKTEEGVQTGDYVYQPAVTLTLLRENPEDGSFGSYGAELAGGLSELTFELRIENTGKTTQTGLTVSLTSLSGTLSLTGTDTDEGLSFSGSTVTAASLAPGETLAAHFTVTLPAAGESAAFRAETSLSCVNPERSGLTKSYCSDSYEIAVSETETVLSVTDESERRASLRDPEDYVLYQKSSEEDETEPQYIWVDSAEGTALDLEIPRLYYRTEITSTNLFSTEVLELSPNAGALFRKIQVHTVTPSELEEELASGGLLLGDMDLVYLSDSSAFGSLECDDLRVLSFGAYTEEADMAYATASNILEAAILYQLPVIADYSLTQLPENTGAYNLRNLAQELFDYAGDIACEGETAELSGELRALIAESIYINNDIKCGNIARGNMSNVLFTYKSTADSERGESKVIGASQVIDEILTDNFYNEEGCYTSEYHVDSADTEIVELSDVTWLRYILNYQNHRTVLYKDSITVLDLEPSGFSTLSEAKLREWIGAESCAISVITIVQMSTSEFIGKLEDLIAVYDMIYIGAGTGDAVFDSGLIYAHVGNKVDKFYFGSFALVKNKNIMQTDPAKKAFYESGNDITEDKYAELLEYAEAGYPIVVDGSLYKDGSLNTEKLDVSSCLYKLLDTVGHGYTNTSYLTEEDYQNASDKENYKRVAECKHTAESGTVSLQRQNYLYNLDESLSYVIAESGYSSTGDQYRVLAGDLSVSSSLTSALSALGTNSVTLNASSVPESLRWTIERSETGYFVRNQNGQYLSVRGTGSGLSAEAVSTDIGRSNSYPGCFYLSEDGTNYYIRIRNGRLESVWNMDWGQDLLFCLYRVTVSSEILTEDITEEEYEQAVRTYGSEEEAEKHGYTRTVRYERSYSNDSLPNVIRHTSGLSSRLAKYINMPRLNLVLISQPAEYSYETNESTGGIIADSITWLQPENGQYYLSYEFEFSNSSENTGASVSYTVSLYADIDSDGQFKETEKLDGLFVTETLTNREADASKLQSGTRYRLTRKLSEDYAGLVPWKLVVSINATGRQNVRSEVIGYTAIRPSQTTTVKVLQILPKNATLNLSSNQSFKTMMDSVKKVLNYDIQIDTAYVSALNSYFPSGKFDSYDMLIIGFDDIFSLQDLDEDVLEAVNDFVNSGRSVMVSHDMTSMTNRDDFTEQIAGWGYNINRYLRAAAGMDRYGYTVFDFLKNQTEDVPLASYDQDSLAEIQEQNKDVEVSQGTVYGDSVGYSNFQLRRTPYEGLVSGVYYFYNEAEGEITTNAISQVNEGQITLFPYDVSITYSDTGTGTKRSESGGVYEETAATKEVATTHAQYYQLDLNYDKDEDGKNDLVVWYSLAEGSVSTNYDYYYGQAVNDVRNNYYLYSVGNVIYTGLGHDDDFTQAEMQLFINTMIASLNSGVKNPVVSITDAETKSRALTDYYVSYDEDGAIIEEGENFGFFVEDVNMVEGKKTIHVWYYYEVTQEEYSANSQASSYKTATDRDGNIVYLKAFSKDPGDSDYVGNALYPVTRDTGQEASSFYDTVENGVLSAVSVKSGWITERLAETDESGHAAVSYTSEDTAVYVHPERIWIGSWASFTGSSAGETGIGFDYVSFKKRTLLELD